MLYYIFKYLDEAYNLPGSGMFQYISFRAAASIILALLIVIIFGRKIIDFLRRKQIGEDIRDLGLEGQLQNAAPPRWAASSSCWRSSSRSCSSGGSTTFTSS